jgi:hypothetical protein
MAEDPKVTLDGEYPRHGWRPCQADDRQGHLSGCTNDYVRTFRRYVPVPRHQSSVESLGDLASLRPATTSPRQWCATKATTFPR